MPFDHRPSGAIGARNHPAHWTRGMDGDDSPAAPRNHGRRLRRMTRTSARGPALPAGGSSVGWLCRRLPSRLGPILGRLLPYRGLAVVARRRRAGDYVEVEHGTLHAILLGRLEAARPG